MRRSALLILFSTFSITVAWAQLDFGIKAGVSTTDVDVNSLNLLDENGTQRLRLALEDARYGIHAGIQLRAQLGKTFLLQPELVFNSNTVEYEVTDLDQTGLAGEVLEEKFQYLDIPLLLGLKLGPLRLMAGPEAHVFIDSSSELLRFDEYDQNFEELTISYLAGAGLDIWNLSFDVRYEGNFNEFGDHIRFAGQNFEFDDSPSRWIFSLGIFFGK